MTEAINLEKKFAKFSEHWSPKVIAQMNDYQLKLVKFQGDFVWHNHPDTDEVFLVIEGGMEVKFRDQTVQVEAGELFVIPKGIEHCTQADDECKAMLIEPGGVVNTGDVESSLTAESDLWI